MFRIGQIITPTKLIRNFSRIADHLAQYPQALLILQRSGQHLLLMDAELFDQMMERTHAESAQLQQDTGLRMELEYAP